MSNTALGLTALLLVIPIIISYKEGLHIIKDFDCGDTTCGRTINHFRILTALYF